MPSLPKTEECRNPTLVFLLKAFASVKCRLVGPRRDGARKWAVRFIDGGASGYLGDVTEAGLVLLDLDTAATAASYCRKSLRKTRAPAPVARAVGKKRKGTAASA